MKTIRHLLALGCLLAATGSFAAELTVFAAASLSDALKTLAPAYTQATGDTLRFNFGASGALARQIREGAPADLILSADELRVEQMEKGGLLLAGTRRTFLANTLVLVAPADSALASLAELSAPGVRRLALGDPATVPAGTYAKEYLEKLGLWTAVQSKAVYLDNVRAVLANVESGNADAGFVYKTDAYASAKTKIAFEIPRADGPSITYPVAVIKDTKSPEAAKKFALWISGPEAAAVFAKYGFLPAP